MLALLIAAPSFMRRVDPAATLKPADGELVSSAEEAVAAALDALVANGTALSYAFPSSFQWFWDAVIDPTFTTAAVAWATWGAAPIVLGALSAAAGWRGSAAKRKRA